jgi:hypothetical protein
LDSDIDIFKRSLFCSNLNALFLVKYFFH